MLPKIRDTTRRTDTIQSKARALITPPKNNHRVHNAWENKGITSPRTTMFTVQESARVLPLREVIITVRSESTENKLTITNNRINQLHVHIHTSIRIITE